MRVVESEVREKAQNTAISLAYRAKYGLLLGDRKNLRNEVVEVIRNQDILYVLILDDEGKEMASRFRYDRDQYELPPLDLIGSLKTNIQLLRDKDYNKFLDVTMPVVASQVKNPEAYSDKLLYGFSEENEDPTSEITQTKRVGAVRIGVTFNNAYERVRRTLYGSIGIFLGVLTAGAFLTLGLLSRVLVTPISQMAATANRIAEGELNDRVKLSGSNEIVSFARSFNRMVDQLQSNIAELERLNDKLRRVNEEKDDFLRAVSHDLNAPLRNIAGMASMLMKRHADSLDDRAKDRIQRIMNNVEREMELISELLELSRIKTRRQPFSYVNLTKIVEQVVDELAYDIEKKEGKVEIKDELPIMWCERNRMKQLFQNLIDNALKYSKPDEAPVIEIGIADKNESEYTFYVKDNGIGIKEEDREKVFHVFRRVRSAETSRIEGKGVGLSAVKRIVETYNGDIWIESEYGKGSTFYITLPIQKQGGNDEQSDS